MYAKKELSGEDNFLACGVDKDASLLVGGRIIGGGSDKEASPRSPIIGVRTTRSKTTPLNRVKHYLSSEDEDGNKSQRVTGPSSSKRKRKKVSESLGSVFPVVPVPEPEVNQAWQWKSKTNGKAAPTAKGLDGPQRRFYCEYAPIGGRAHCSLPACSQKIAYNDVRIACEPADGFKYRRWYHSRCFFAREARGPSPNRGLTQAKFLTCQADVGEELDEIYNWIDVPPFFTNAELGLKSKPKPVVRKTENKKDKPVEAQVAPVDECDLTEEKYRMLSMNVCTLALPAETVRECMAAQFTPIPIDHTTTRAFQSQLEGASTANLTVFDSHFHELQADFCGLQECRVLGETTVDREDLEFQYYFSGAPPGTRRDHGVGFAVR